jgi:transcriptional regulator with PAS, ATPase and Fis domain
MLSRRSQWGRITREVFHKINESFPLWRPKSIKKETLKALLDYSWPGNVRELESIMEQAVNLCPRSVLQLADKLEISSPLISSAVRTLEATE